MYTEQQNKARTYDQARHSAAQRRRKAAAATSRLNFRLPGSNRPTAAVIVKHWLGVLAVALAGCVLAAWRGLAAVHPMGVSQHFVGCHLVLYELLRGML